MDRADQIIPGMPPSQLTNPFFATGQVIHFQSYFDNEAGMIKAGLFNFGEVGIQVGGLHAPFIKIIARHGAVVGKANLLQPESYRMSRQLGRFPDCMPT